MNNKEIYILPPPPRSPFEDLWELAFRQAQDPPADLGVIFGRNRIIVEIFPGYENSPHVDNPIKRLEVLINKTGRPGKIETYTIAAGGLEKWNFKGESLTGVVPPNRNDDTDQVNRWKNLGAQKVVDYIRGVHLKIPSSPQI